MANYDDKIKSLLEVPGVTGVAITNANGQVETSTLAETDPELGTIASSMYSNIGVQIKRMQRGTLKRLVLETDAGITVLSGIAGGGLLVLFADITEGFNLSKLVGAIGNF